MAFIGRDLEFDGYVVGYKNLHEAAIGGTAIELERFINAGADVNGQNDIGKTPLHEAAYFGCDRNVRNLIIHGAKLNITDEQGRTPLHLACTNHPSRQELSLMTTFFGVENKGYRKGADALIAAGANINAQDKDGWTPLHHAVYGAHDKLVSLLLDRGANPAIEAKGGITALDVATQTNREPVKKMISERISAIAKTNQQPE